MTVISQACPYPLSIERPQYRTKHRCRASSLADLPQRRRKQPGGNTEHETVPGMHFQTALTKRAGIYRSRGVLSPAGCSSWKSPLIWANRLKSRSLSGGMWWLGSRMFVTLRSRSRFHNLYGWGGKNGCPLSLRICSVIPLTASIPHTARIIKSTGQ